MQTLKRERERERDRRVNRKAERNRKMGVESNKTTSRYVVL